MCSFIAVGSSKSRVSSVSVQTKNSYSANFDDFVDSKLFQCTLLKPLQLNACVVN